MVGLFFALLTPFQGGKDMGPVCCVRGWQGMGWGGGLILSNAQKTKFRRSQIGRHPNPSPAGERLLVREQGSPNSTDLI